MNEISFRAPQSNSQTLQAPVAPQSPAMTEESAHRLIADLRRDLQQQIDWQGQRQVAPHRGPSGAEAGMVLGSLAVGAIVTSVLIVNSTTVAQGLFGTQAVSRADILPFVVVVWLALLAINLVWARRR